MTQESQTNGENDAAIARRWRDVCRAFSEIVETKVVDLAFAQSTDDRNGGGEAAQKAPGEDAKIRQISALVIAARRSMEMQDRYERRRGAEEPAEDYREKAARDLKRYEDELRRLIDDERRNRSVHRAAEEGDTPQ